MNEPDERCALCVLLFGAVLIFGGWKRGFVKQEGRRSVGVDFFRWKREGGMGFLLRLFGSGTKGERRALNGKLIGPENEGA